MAAAKKPSKKAKPDDPREALKTRIAAGKTIFAKHQSKDRNDPKRRLALKKLKRSHRALGKIVAIEKRAAAAKAKAAAAEA